MNEIIAETKEEVEEEIIYNKNEENNKHKIMDYSIWKILAYFIIYSIVGLIIETIFAFVKDGVISSRQSFLHGPFCAIYGVGAVIMIIALQYFKKNKITLFIGGFLVGSIVEYIVSFVGETLIHVKWWDYSNMPLNIDGRVCVFFSLFWGVLAIWLIRSFNPIIDKIINFFNKKVNTKLLKILIIFIMLFMIFEVFFTAFALRMFTVKMANEYELELKYVEKYEDAYLKLYENDFIKNIVDKYCSNKKMLMTFPNLKFIDKDGNIILVRDILTDIDPYYYKINYQ